MPETARTVTALRCLVCMLSMLSLSMHYMQVMDEEMIKLRQERGDARYYGGHFEEARGLFARFSTSPELADFLTLAAYEYIVVVPMAQRSRL